MISYKSAQVPELLGKTLVGAIEVHKTYENDAIEFVAESGEKYLMTHVQDCCEGVFIEDICGDLSDLVGEPILLAEEVDGKPPQGWTPSDESSTWTFYKIGTRKGVVTLRWLGESNGYYSESVDFFRVIESESD